MKKNTVIGAGVAVALLAAAASYFSPHYTLYQMKQAIDNKDADALNEMIDFPAMRDNFKGQMLALIQEEMSSEEMKNNPFAGFGQMMATAMVGAMADTLISPAGVTAMLASGKAPSNAADVVRVNNDDGAEAKDRDYSIAYRSWSKVEVTPKLEDTDPVHFVLKREGLFSWKMTGVQMPASVFDKKRP